MFSKSALFLTMLAFTITTAFGVDIYYYTYMGDENDDLEFHKYSIEEGTNQYICDIRAALAYGVYSLSDGRICYQRFVARFDTYEHTEETLLYDPNSGSMETIDGILISDYRNGKYIGRFDYGWDKYLNDFKNGRIEYPDLSSKEIRITELDAISGKKRKFITEGWGAKYTKKGNIVYDPIYYIEGKNPVHLYIIDRDGKELGKIVINDKYFDKDAGRTPNDISTFVLSDNDIYMATNYYVLKYSFSETETSFIIDEPDLIYESDHRIEACVSDGEGNLYLAFDSGKYRDKYLILNPETGTQEVIPEPSGPGSSYGDFVVLP